MMNEHHEPGQYLGCLSAYIKRTMVQNKKKHRINTHLINHFPGSKGVSEVSERVSAAEGTSKASSPEQANE